MNNQILRFKRFLLKVYRYLFLPHIEIRCESKWFGNSYGGFYVNPQIIDQNSIVYSFGIGKDISFDRGLIAEYSCQVHGFDPTPKSIQWISTENLPPNFLFHPYGISVSTGTYKFYLPRNKQRISGSLSRQKYVNSQDSIVVHMKSLADIMDLLGHEKISVLKMDIEGSEFEVLENIMQLGIDIDQIAVEFHHRFYKYGLVKLYRVLRFLRSRGYMLFAISRPHRELSFIHRSSVP